PRETTTAARERALHELRLAEQEYDTMRIGDRPFMGELPIPNRGPDPNLSDREYLDHLEGRDPSEPLDPGVAREILGTPHPGLIRDANSYAESNFDYPSVARTDEELHDRAMENREFQEGPQSEESIALDAAIDAGIAADEAEDAEVARRDEERREQQRRELEPRHPPADEGGYEPRGGPRGPDNSPGRHSGGTRRTGPRRPDDSPEEERGYASERRRPDDPPQVEGESHFRAKSSFFRIIYDPLAREITNADNEAARTALKRLKETFEKDSKRSFRYGPRHPRQLNAGVLRMDDDDLFDIIDALHTVLSKWARGADGDEITRKQALLDYLQAIDAT
ncbi:uncharacterized protein METZ01_LOCUS333460, partial [marine metagenome]